MVSCPGQPDVPCADYGFTYNFTNGQPVCASSVTGPVCTRFAPDDSGLEGSYYCRKLRCDWTREYCDDEVARDENGAWTCLGECRARTQPSPAASTAQCSCSPSGDAAQPPDVDAGEYCYYGSRADPAMWSPPAEVALSPGVWRRPSAFTDAFGDVSLWAGQDATGYDKVTVAFLRTDCPTLSPVSIDWPVSGAANSTASSASRLVRQVFINSCGCRKADGVWISKPQ